MSLHAAHFRDAFYQVPGCVRHLYLCGAAAEGLLRLLPADCVTEAVTDARGLESHSPDSCDGVFLALLPSEFGSVRDWAAACALLPGRDLMVFLLAENRAQVDMLSESFQPDFVPYVYRELTSGVLLAALTHPEYDPVAHGQSYRERCDFAAAYHTICFVPENLLDDVARARLEGVRLMWLHEWAKADGLDRDYVLTRAQIHAFDAVSRSPDNQDVLLALAAIWRYCGDSERAEALAKSLAAEDRRSVQWRPPSATRSTIETPGEPLLRTDWRILLVTDPRPHYGLDVLYDGLYRLLGPEGVVEYPWKATLHGALPTKHGSYPCHFAHPAQARHLEEVAAALDAGAFDAVLWGDCEDALPLRDVQTLAAHCQTVPLWILDAVDECVDIRAAVEERIGRKSAGYFKREMVRCIDYGPESYPFPFAYAHGLATPQLEGRAGLFWAGQRRFGMRRLYMEPVEAWLGQKLENHYSQEAYREALCQALVGLNLCGAGFDTVRYWELPAHGAVLLTEDVPIVIPENFRDGVDALVFKTPQEALERLAWALAHPEAAAEMGELGRQRFRAHHTSEARARQVLDRLNRRPPNR